MEYEATFIETCRQYGEERIGIAAKAKSTEDWQQLWTSPAHPYPFIWGTCWKMCMEYRVDDYAAEVGFFLDVLGLDSISISPEFTLLTNPAQDFVFSVKPAGSQGSTPPDALRLQFMLSGLLDTFAELEDRGILFSDLLHPCEDGSSLYTCVFQTPHGIAVDLWGLVPIVKTDLPEATISAHK